MILMGYGGFGLAILLTGIIGIEEAVSESNRTAACFVYAHVILLTFLLIGLRHLFTIPVEWKANWTFQIAERQGRLDWMQAVDRFTLFWGAVLMLAIPLPLEARLLGWRAVAEVGLFVAFGLLCYEWVFTDWQKLPFTCSHLPGKIPMWILALWGIGILSAFPLVNGLLLVSLYHPITYAVILGVLAAIWLGLYSARRQGFGELRLMYDDVPDPAIHGLNLSR
jgi:hypothetical protein